MIDEQKRWGWFRLVWGTSILEFTCASVWNIIMRTWSQGDHTVFVRTLNCLFVPFCLFIHRVILWREYELPSNCGSGRFPTVHYVVVNITWFSTSTARTKFGINTLLSAGITNIDDIHNAFSVRLSWMGNSPNWSYHLWLALSRNAFLIKNLARNTRQDLLSTCLVLIVKHRVHHRKCCSGFLFATFFLNCIFQMVGDSRSFTRE